MIKPRVFSAANPPGLKPLPCEASASRKRFKELVRKGIVPRAESPELVERLLRLLTTLARPTRHRAWLTWCYAVDRSPTGLRSIR